MTKVKDLLNRKNSTKFERISSLIILYFIVVTIAIVIFGYIFYRIDQISVLSSPDMFETSKLNSIENSIYFSGITFLTIGYGDISPVVMSVKFLAIIEGVIGLIINGVFVALIIYNLQLRDNKILINEELIVVRNGEKYELLVGMKNFGDFLVSVERGIEFRTLENGSSNYICDISDTKIYFKEWLRMPISSSEHPKVFKLIQEHLNGQKKLQVRYFVKGINTSTGDIVAALEEFDVTNIYFLKSFEVNPNIIKINRRQFDLSKETNFIYGKYTVHEEKEIIDIFKSMSF